MATINNIKELTRGDTGMYSITLYDEEGAEYIPDSDDVLTFYLLKKNCDELDEALLIKDIPISTMQLEIEPSESLALSAGTYQYKIRLKDASDHEWTVVKSQMKIIC